MPETTASLLSTQAVGEAVGEFAPPPVEATHSLAAGFQGETSGECTQAAVGHLGCRNNGHFRGHGVRLAITGC